MRLAQQLLHLGRLDRLLVAFDFGHGLAELLRAYRAGFAAQAADGLFNEAKGAIEREGAAALFGGGWEGRRLLGRWDGVLVASLALVPASPTPTTATATAAFTALTFAWPFEGPKPRGLSRRAGDAGTQPDLVLAIIEFGQGDEAFVGRLYHELGEAGEPQILLVECGIDLLHDLLQAVGPHYVAMRRHLLYGLDHEVPGIVPRVRDVAFFCEAGQLVVGVVLVAVLDQQVAGRFADPHADHVFAVLFELQHERGEIRIARQQDEGADLGSREDELEGVDREADVCRVFLVRPVRRRPDHVDRRLGQRDDVLRVATPIGVGALYGHFSLDDVRLQQASQLRLEIRADPHRHIVEVDHQRRVGRMGGGFVVHRSWQMGLRRLRHVVVSCSSCPRCARMRRRAVKRPDAREWRKRGR